MRGYGGIVALVLGTAIACYSPTVRPGAPCSLDLDNCPRGQRCELVGGDSICIEIGGSHIDAMIDDASIDARIDAMTDGPMPLGTWTLVQHEGEQGVDVSFDESEAGNLIIVGIETAAASAVTAVSDDVGNTYVRATGSRSVHVQEDFGVEVWYSVNAAAGATEITATAPLVHGLVMWEVDGFGSADPLGNVAKVDNQATSTTPDGAPITTTTTGEFVVAILIVQNVITAIRPGSAFTNDEMVFGNGWAHLTSNTAPAGTYTAEWNATNGVSCASSVAFRVN
jgi:hypothetical protein